MIAVAIAGWLVAALLGGALLGARGRLELIARAEHELRGPVTTLSLAAGSELQTEVDRLRVALDDLAAARTGGRALAQAGPVALDELVQGAARSWRPVAIRAGGGVEVDWRAGPVSVRADRRRLSQVLGNLLANAVEHGHGRIELRGRRTPSGVRVEVADSGPGFGTTARQLSLIHI